MRVKSQTLASSAAGLLLLFPALTAAVHSTYHQPYSRRALSHGHHHHHHVRSTHSIRTLRKRAGTCAFPTDAGLVPVTPGEKNAGWALSPDQACVPGMYCPYACPSGQVMAQWDPSATTYSYPQSQNGGLYCNEDGEIEKPFPEKPYCVDGAGTVAAVNEAGASVAICQTVLPGNEAMLIPTDVQRMSTLAVPDESYWARTAAHYYVNPPGVSTEEGCVWGTNQNPVGNWAPYVAGANQVSSGETYVTIGWNPIYLEDTTPFRDVTPDYGIRVECNGKGCQGLPCYIDPAEHDVNEISQDNPPGAGGANFCVVSVPKGSAANIVVFNRSTGKPVQTSTVRKEGASKTSAPPKKTATPVKKTPTTTSKEQVTTTDAAKRKSKESSSSTTESKSKSEGPKSRIISPFTPKINNADEDEEALVKTDIPAKETFAPAEPLQQEGEEEKESSATKVSVSTGIISLLVAYTLLL